MNKKRRFTDANSHSGFSLVELSIVLTIIGLLAGGILAGSNMIKTAQLQSILTQKETFTTAVGTFRERYNGLPGDLPTATNVWGAVDSNPANCTNISTVSNDTKTCNGDGNRQISSYDLTADAYERHRAWQHLSNAGLAEGKYTGVKASGANWHVRPGLNAPTADIEGVGWTLFYVGNQEGDPWLFDGSYGHTLYVGKESASSSTNMPFLTPEEAWLIDKKFDDGMPARGFMVSKYVNNSDCTDGATGTDDLDVAYKLSVTTASCMFIFRNLF